MRPRFQSPRVFLASLTLSTLACSGSDGGSGGSASGGVVSSGTSTGGSVNGTSAGGGSVAVATGGMLGSGGSANPASTGALGGAPSVGGQSGSISVGGAVAGGASSAGGVVGTGGTKAAGGVTATSSTKASGGTTSASATAAGGATTAGGTKAAGGTSAAGGSKAAGGTTTAPLGGTSAGGTSAGGASACGATPNPNPFGCQFAWGLNGVSPTTYPYVQFISNWAGYNIRADGTFSSCDQCNWLKNTMANASQVPVLIAYFLGYYGHANGLPDGNLGGPPNLTTGMGALLLGVANAACPSGVICENNLMVKAYAWYAAQVYAVYKKPIIWWLEGDFIQYSPEGAQTQPLSYDQTGQLAAQITRAIKCNDPAAVVAWNYSTWISTTERDQYFNAINANMTKLGTSWEMVWTSGKGNTANAGTGTTWAQLYTASGNKWIMSDESFGASVANDTWSNQTASTINARIAQHVVGVDITTSTIPSYLQTNVTSTLAPGALGTTCF